MDRRNLLLGMAAAGGVLVASPALAAETPAWVRMPSNGEGLSFASPSSVLSVHFNFTRADVVGAIPTYEVRRFGRTIVAPSKLGFRLAGAPDLQGDLSLVQTLARSVDETWEQPWGEKRLIRNHYNELVLSLVESKGLQRRLDVIFRLYDDGLGFRYRFPEQPNLKDVRITEELTEIAFADPATAFWIPARLSNRYEYLYRTTPLAEVPTAHTPITLRTEEGLHIAVHEAALVDYSAMALKRIDGQRFQTQLAPWSDGILVRAKAPFVTPWRTLQIADTAGGLIENYLILNLNEPNALGDVSWVKPAKYLGVWWGMHLGVESWHSGPIHGANTANVKRYIDFAAKHGFKGVLVEGWNIGWDGDWVGEGAFDFAKPYPDFDMEELARYGKSKGVYIIGHHETSGNVANYEAQLTASMAYAAKNGIRAIKTGYVANAGQIRRKDENGQEHREFHDGQYMARHHLRVVQEAAKQKIAINAHEPIKDTGLRRTYPNWVSREGARGQEYNAWGNPGNPPEHTVMLPFTRMLAGPMDYTPGVFDLLNSKRQSDDGTRISHTLAKELALYVALYSPIQMACDLPEHYEANLPAFQFIKDVPCDWEDTKVLAAEIADYLVIARRDRNSRDWYLGALTDENGRNFAQPLSFLERGVVYTAQIYRDGAEADWRSKPADIVIESGLVTAETVLPLRLAAGGGQAVRFTLASAADRKRLKKI